MKDFMELTTEELKEMDKDVLITMFVALQGQLKSMNRQLEFITEQVALMNQRSFARRPKREILYLTVNLALMKSSTKLKSSSTTRLNPK